MSEILGDITQYRRYVDWLWSHCKIICFPMDGRTRYIEHDVAAGKQARDLIEAEMEKSIKESEI